MRLPTLCSLVLLGSLTACKEKSAAAVEPPTEAVKTNKAPWPITGAEQVAYQVSVNIPARGVENLTMQRLRTVTRDSQDPMKAKVEVRENGRLMNTDFYQYKNERLYWTGFEIASQPTVMFKNPLPIFSPNFQGGERWGKPEALMISVVGWVDVPLSSGAVKACKVLIEYNQPEKSFKRQLWFHPELGIVFEDANYYDDRSVTRHETATMMSVSGDDDAKK